MKIFLTNRADVQIFCDDKRLPVRKEKGMEYVETGTAIGEGAHGAGQRRNGNRPRGYGAKGNFSWPYPRAGQEGGIAMKVGTQRFVGVMERYGQQRARHVVRAGVQGPERWDVPVGQRVTPFLSFL